MSEFIPPRDEHGRARFNCLRYLNAAYEELYKWQNDSSPARLDDARRRFLFLCQQLSREVLGQPGAWLRWRWFPNFHLLLHLSTQALEWGNPKDIWNYLDESAIGLGADVAESVHIRTFAKSVMQKWMVLFKLRR